MKILGVNNTIFYEEDNFLFLNKETGNFFLNLKNYGNKISLFQLSQLKTSNDRFANFNVSEHEFKIFEVKRRKSRLIPFLKAFFLVQKAILENDFVYIFYPGPICQVIATLCLIYRIPYGLYIRGEQNIESNLSKYLLKNARLIFTISPIFTNRITKLNPNVHTIRPMISFSEKDLSLERQFLNKKKIKLLYVGRIVFDKGLFELVDSLKMLLDNGNNLSLSIVGSGSDQSKLLRIVETYGIRSHVEFFGMISDKNHLHKIFLDNDIFVLPSYHEGFPRVLYEAMLMRMPIVTTFVGTIGYLMKDNFNCLEIIPKSSESIVFALEKLIKSPEFAKRISDNGSDTILTYLQDKKISHAEHLSSILNISK